MSPEAVLNWIHPASSAATNAAFIAACAVASLLLFYALASLPVNARKPLVAAATFTAGLFYMVEFFWPNEETNPFTPWVVPVGNLLKVVAVFTIGMGVLNLCSVHGKTIARKRENWGNSVAFFVALVAMVGAGFWSEYFPLAFSGVQSLPADGAGVLTPAQAAYSVVFNGFYVPLDSTMFSLLAFFIVSAAYRAFRVRTTEAGLMMAAALIVMLGQVGVGQWLTHWIPLQSWWSFLRLERVSHWLLTGINAAAFRGITFGAMMGLLALSLRTWLSLERGAYFDAEM